MIVVTHNEKPTASGTTLHSGGRLGMHVSGKFVEEFGDTFIIVNEGGWNVYHKVDPTTIKFN